MRSPVTTAASGIRPTDPVRSPAVSPAGIGYHGGAGHGVQTATPARVQRAEVGDPVPLFVHARPVSAALAFALTATTATTATFTSSAVVLDQEVGYIPFDHDAANLFLQLVASRYEQGSILVTSNLPFGRWGEVFGDEVVAAAMIDRLVHHAEVLTLAGDSYRTRARRELLAKDRDH